MVVHGRDDGGGRGGDGGGRRRRSRGRRSGGGSLDGQRPGHFDVLARNPPNFGKVHTPRFQGKDTANWSANLPRSGRRHRRRGGRPIDGRATVRSLLWFPFGAPDQRSNMSSLKINKMAAVVVGARCIVGSISESRCIVGQLNNK